MENFTEKLITLQPALKSYAVSLVRYAEDADDLVQETFLKALTYQKKFKEGTNLKAWAYTILRNTFINQYHRGKLIDNMREDHKELLHARPVGPEESLAHKEIGIKMNELNEDLKEPLKMYSDGYHYNEIAEKMSIPLGTVKSRIFKARKSLSHSLTAA